MPYRSKKQRKWIRINKPDLAEKWEKEYGDKIVSAAKPRRERTKSKKSRKRQNKRRRNGG